MGLSQGREASADGLVWQTLMAFPTAQQPRYQLSLIFRKQSMVVCSLLVLPRIRVMRHKFDIVIRLALVHDERARLAGVVEALDLLNL
jgi:hypothetical protein